MHMRVPTDWRPRAGMYGSQSQSVGLGWNQDTPPNGLRVEKSGSGDKYPLRGWDASCIQSGWYSECTPTSAQRQAKCPLSKCHIRLTAIPFRLILLTSSITFVVRRLHGLSQAVIMHQRP